MKHPTVLSFMSAYSVRRLAQPTKVPQCSIIGLQKGHLVLCRGLSLARLQTSCSLHSRTLHNPEKISSVHTAVKRYPSSSASSDTQSDQSHEIEARLQKALDASESSRNDTLSQHLNLYVKHYEHGTCIAIELNRPEKRNALSLSLLNDLTTAFRAISHHDRVRVVSLTATQIKGLKNPVFCAGADISALSSLSSPEEARALIQRVSGVGTAIRQLPVPVLCLMDGLCVGAGLEIAASCDIRVATQASSFSMPETKIGIPSVVEARLLADLLGWGRMREFLLTGRAIHAAEALSSGLVTAVADDRSHLDKMQEEYFALFAKMGAKGMRAQKKLITQWEEGTVQEGIDAGVEAFAGNFEDGGKDFREQLARARG